MRIGGGGRERWMVVMPILGLVVLGNVVLGGPEQTLRAIEQMFVEALDIVRPIWRR